MPGGGNLNDERYPHRGLQGRRVWDSRGRDRRSGSATDGGAVGRRSRRRAPHRLGEAIELRDGGTRSAGAMCSMPSPRSMANRRGADRGRTRPIRRLDHSLIALEARPRKNGSAAMALVAVSDGGMHAAANA